MASSINADNGVSSGSAGLKSSADSSGVLQFQTNGTTALSIDASQNVSFTNQPTYSGGTANGVAYLNGSKVLTTGSALKFDGTALAIGSVTPSTWMLDVKSAGTGVVTNGIRFNRSSVTTQYGVFNYESGQFNNVVVNTAGTGCFWGVLYSSDGSTTTQPLALDASGRLGVGTSSPNNTLDVVSSGDVARFGNTKKLYVSTDSSGYGLFSAAGQTGTGLYASDTSSFIYFATGSTERARIDSSGNFSITQTPGKYTVDVTGGATSIANSGVVDFSNASGMLVVNNFSLGGVALWLCGAGSVVLISTVASGYGSLAYNAGIDGYRWTNNSGSTASFGFFFVRTRPNA